MSKFYKYANITQIFINEDIDYFSNLFFETVKKRLTESYVFHIKQVERELEFKGSIFRFVWNAWDVFNPITKGKIRFLTIDEEPFIKFEINFTEALIIASLFSIIPIFAFAFEPTISLIIFAAIWFLYLLNYLVASIRFKGYIAKTMIEVRQASDYDNQLEISNNQLVINN